MIHQYECYIFKGFAHYSVVVIAIWIGIDDTDSTKGMCTTYLISELIEEFKEYDILGYPRLVRLNPNIPWKTRGNGAVCVHFGSGAGERVLVCMLNKKAYFSYENGEDTYVGGATKEAILERVRDIVQKHAFFDDKKTNPGIVVADTKPKKEKYDFYQKTVRVVVDKKEAEAVLKDEKAAYFSYKNGRGLIGATAALCYAPHDKTYEIIAYRKKERWGTKRNTDVQSVIAMDKGFPNTFDNYDYVNKHVKIAPNSPCPVLFGIRGDDPRILVDAMKSIKSEQRERWTIFETNQGTDEHLQRKKIADVQRYDSVIVKGRVTREPSTLAGGHVIFGINDESGGIDCAAYEPTKQFRNIIRALKLSDVVEVYGSIHKKELTINVEKIYIKELAHIRQKIANPLCQKCNKRMKSRGKNQGYKCQTCGVVAAEDDALFLEIPREIKKGFYEVPVCARRHLSMPLKRMHEQKK
jgi:tRNA(Ile2)-agmatinylcytidine synthase